MYNKHAAASARVVCGGGPCVPVHPDGPRAHWENPANNHPPCHAVPHRHERGVQNTRQAGGARRLVQRDGAAADPGVQIHPRQDIPRAGDGHVQRQMAPDGPRRLENTIQM